MVWGLNNSAHVAAFSSGRPLIRPLSIMNAAHRAMSETLDQIEPAAATGSTAALLITRISPATF